MSSVETLVEEVRLGDERPEGHAVRKQRGRKKEIRQVKGWRRERWDEERGEGTGGDGGGVGVPGWGCVELIIFRCLSWRPQT